MFSGEEASALSFTDEAVVINSFSKYFGMTGWRLGWLVAPQAWVPAIERLAQNWFLAPSTVAQHAAMAAFGEESLAIAEQTQQEEVAAHIRRHIRLYEQGQPFIEEEEETGSE